MPRRSRANIQFHVQPLSLDKFGDPLHRFPAITVSACNLQPTSRGTVRIRSAKIDEAPSIAPNYLATDEDRQVAADAIRTTRRLMKQKALEKYHPVEFLPGPSVGDDDASLAKAAGDIGTTIFHPVGTAKMGTAQRRQCRGRRAVALLWHRGLAHRGCLRHADHHLRQYQHADRDDRRKGRSHDFGGCTRVSRFWSPVVRGLSPYVPGEQPKLDNLIKLNTNENPYPPSPHVLAAIAAATDRLRLYPDPRATSLRETIATYYNVAPEEVFVGNGSDEVLAHTFLGLLKHDAPLLFPDITYSFFPVWCQLYGISHETVPLDAAMRRADRRLPAAVQRASSCPIRTRRPASPFRAMRSSNL